MQSAKKRRIDLDQYEGKDASEAATRSNRLSGNGTLKSVPQSTMTSGHPPTSRLIPGSRSIFVRGLSIATTSESLSNFFSALYPLRHTTVVVNKNTGQSKGFGFVTFADAEQANDVISTLDGTVFEGSKLALEVAEPRERLRLKSTKSTGEPRASVTRNISAGSQGVKLIIRNLPWSVSSEKQLHGLFATYGRIKHVTLPRKNSNTLSGFGFVTYHDHTAAARALTSMNGSKLDSRALAVDWAVEKEKWESISQSNLTKVTEPLESSPDDTSSIHHLSEEADSENRQDDSTDRSVSSYAPDTEAGPIAIVSPEKRMEKVPNHSTLFLRNVPFNTTEEELYAKFRGFGPLNYVRIVYDKRTGLSKGTAFVCFHSESNARSCLSMASNIRRTSRIMDSGTGPRKASVLQNTSSDPDGAFVIEDRILHVSSAVGHNEASRLKTEKPTLSKSSVLDRRHLYLLSEAMITSKNPLHEKLSNLEIQAREDGLSRRKSLLKKNPSLYVSLTRLSVRNLPRSMSSKKLKALAREAVVGYAKDVKAGSRERISAEESSRDSIQKDMKAARNSSKKGVVKQAKIVFENREGSKIPELDNAGRSRGYGFVEYSSHRLALMGIRWLNGHQVRNGEAGNESKDAALFPGGKRLTVEFALENAQVTLRRRRREMQAKNAS